MSEPKGSSTGEREPPSLTRATMARALEYLVPPSSEGMPGFLLSSQQKLRHLYLDIEAKSDPAAYYCLTPDHPSQDVKSLLSTLEELSTRPQRPEELLGEVVYCIDEELLTAHVILGQAIQVVFSSEMDDESGLAEWKYLDVKALPVSSPSYASVHDAVLARGRKSTKRGQQRSTIGSALDSPIGTGGGEDSYWSRYDNVAPSVSNGHPKGQLHVPFLRNDSAAGLSQRSSSPRREDAYWDRYGYDSDDDEEEGAAHSLTVPARAEYSLSHHQPVWPTTTARGGGISPEDLSEALAMHLQPGAEDQEMESSLEDAARGPSINLETPPQVENVIPTAINLESPTLDVRMPQLATPAGPPRIETKIILRV